MTAFAVKTDVLVALKAGPVWFKKALRCKNVAELERVMVDFGRAKGFKVMEVPA